MQDSNLDPKQMLEYNLQMAYKAVKAEEKMYY
jgi:hypothetical protein